VVKCSLLRDTDSTTNDATSMVFILREIKVGAKCAGQLHAWIACDASDKRAEGQAFERKHARMQAYYVVYRHSVTNAVTPGTS
jgi:hypothetical protein